MHLPRSFSSLYQHPSGGRRTDAEEAAFARALGVMGDLYASAIGTTVLQLKNIPPRPPEYDGAICLFDLAPHADEATIKMALAEFGTIKSVTVGGWPPAVVRFATHDTAIAVKEAAERLKGIAGGIDTLYNERPYDDGHGGDGGRGWCAVCTLSRASAQPLLTTWLCAAPLRAQVCLRVIGEQ